MNATSHRIHRARPLAALLTVLVAVIGLAVAPPVAAQDEPTFPVEEPVQDDPFSAEEPVENDPFPDDGTPVADPLVDDDTQMGDDPFSDEGAPVDDDPLVDEGAPGDDDLLVEGGLVDEEIADEPAAGDGAIDHDAVAAERRRMWIIVGGLITVAVALLILTIRYWVVTRPLPAGARSDGDDPDGHDVDGDDHDDPSPVSSGRRSRRAIAGADHAHVDGGWEPRTTGEHLVVDPATEPPRARPSRGGRSTILADED